MDKFIISTKTWRPLPDNIANFDKQILARGVAIHQAMAQLKAILESLDFSGFYANIPQEISLSGNDCLTNAEAIADINWQKVAELLYKDEFCWVCTHIADYYIELTNYHFCYIAE